MSCIWVIFSGRGEMGVCMLAQLSQLTVAVTHVSQVSELVNAYLSLLHRAMKMDIADN